MRAGAAQGQVGATIPGAGAASTVLRAQLAARVVAALDERDLEDFDRISKPILVAFEAPADGNH